MPLYEYKCESCGKTFEALQKFSDEPILIHDECGGHVERLISSPAFHFKGTGWYVTDYAKTNGHSSATKPDGSDSNQTADKKAEKAEKAEKSDSKPKTETSSAAPAKSESSPAPASTASTSTDKK